MEWVSARDRLPEAVSDGESGPVVVFIETPIGEHGYRIGHYDTKERAWAGFHTLLRPHVTHWMPLEAPGKQP